MDTLILTLQLFTSLPIKKEIEVTDERLIRGVALWPVAGILVGLFDGLIFWLASRIFPIPVAAALALLGELWMTRGFHLDGLCDTTDALFSSRNRERMLEIMKDSHIGTFGVAALVCDLGFKFLLITSSAMPLYLILAAPVAGKMVQAIAMYRANYPREKGLGKSYIGRISPGITLSCTLLGGLWVGIVLFLGGSIWWQPLIALLLCCLFAWLLRHHMVKKLGGMTGDTLGAVSELVEIFLMLAMVALEGVG